MLLGQDHTFLCIMKLGALIPALGRSPGVGNGNPLQYSYWKFHGQGSLVGYSPLGHKESDTTEHALHMKLVWGVNQ